MMRKSINFLGVLVVLAAVLVCTQVTQADIIPVLDQQQTVQNLATLYAGTDYATAQTISPTLRYLFGVRNVWVGYVAGGSANLTLEVRGFSIENPSPTAGHVVLGSQTFAVNMNNEYAFDFTSPIDLNGYLNTDGWGKVMLVFTSDSPAGDPLYMGGSNNGTSYAPGGASNGGTLFGAWPSTWLVKNLDLGFATYGGSDVPEPATMGLLGVGGLLTMLRKRR